MATFEKNFIRLGTHAKPSSNWNSVSEIIDAGKNPNIEAVRYYLSEEPGLKFSGQAVFQQPIKMYFPDRHLSR